MLVLSTRAILKKTSV